MKAIIILLIVLLIAGCEGEVIEETTEIHQEATETTTDVKQDTQATDNSKEQPKEVEPQEPSPLEKVTGTVISNSINPVEELTQPIEEQALMQMQPCNIDQYFTCVDQNNDQCYAECPLEMVPCPPSSYATAGCFDFNPDCLAACDESVSQDCMDSSGCTPDDL